MPRKVSEFALVALAGLFAAAPALAQNSVSQIDSEHSTARLYLASTTNPGANLNVGVARTSGVVKTKSGHSAIPDFDFTIYPAYKKESLAKSIANHGEEDPNYTVIAFKSRRVVPLSGDTYRVSGDLTLTYVQQTVSYDLSEGYSGPAYGPSITISQTEPASFEFRRAASSANSANGEWIASSTIHAEDFPQLLTAVSSDFSGEVSTQIAPSITTEDQAQTLSAARHHQKADANHLVANEVEIQLDLFTTGSGSTAAASGQ